MRNITKSLLESLNEDVAKEDKIVKNYEKVSDWNVDILGELNDGRFFLVLDNTLLKHKYLSQFYSSPVQISDNKYITFEELEDESCHNESEDEFDDFLERLDFVDCDEELTKKILKEVKRK